jgi:hypothetical protein
MLQRLASLTCPSDLLSSMWGYPLHNYVACAGNAGIYGTTPFGAPATFVRYNGMFDYGLRVQKIKFTDVLDGTSNTLMLSELLQGQPQSGISYVDLRGFVYWGSGCGFSSFFTPNSSSPDQTYDGTTPPPLTGSYCINQPNLNLPCIGANTGAGSTRYAFSARSRHPGGVNACLGDASVRFFTNGVDPDTWQYMGGFNDGKNITFD